MITKRRPEQAYSDGSTSLVGSMAGRHVLVEHGAMAQTIGTVNGCLCNDIRLHE
jgi:hypothetical protein